MSLERRLRELELELSGPDASAKLIPEESANALDELAARKASAETPEEMEAVRRDIRAAMARDEGGRA